MNWQTVVFLAFSVVCWLTPFSHDPLRPGPGRDDGEEEF